jgi:hypothetical protein
MLQKKAFITTLTATALTLGMSSAAMAGKARTGNGSPSGHHYTVNLIGVKNPKNFDVGAESSGGSSVFIPLRTEDQPSHYDGYTCTDNNGNQTDFVDDTYPTWTTTDPNPSTKISFEPTTDGDFEILDRDATDGEAIIQIPVGPDDPENGPTDKVVAVDLFVRVLGGPGGCAELEGWAYDSDDTEPNDNNGQENTWWWSGTIYLDRKAKRSTFVKATDIFNVWWCDIDYDDVDSDNNTDECIAGSEEELSVFNDVFEDYYWKVYNHDTKLIQLGFYPKN